MKVIPGEVILEELIPEGLGDFPLPACLFLQGCTKHFVDYVGTSPDIDPDWNHLWCQSLGQS